MLVQVSGRWRSGYLDEVVPPGACRVRVTRWTRVAPVTGMFFERPRAPRLLLNYLAEYGWRPVARKAISRARENARNSRWVAAGRGVVVESRSAEHPMGQPVEFVAPAAAEAQERVVLAAGLLRADPGGDSGGAGIAVGELPAARRPVLRDLPGWLPGVGLPLPEAEVEAVLAAVRPADVAAPPGGSVAAPPGGSVAARTRRRAAAAPTGSRPPAAVWGLGNYTRSVMLPEVTRWLEVVRVHELDPLLLGPRPRFPEESTDPGVDPDLDLRAGLVASYHHTHADLALALMSRGAVALVEKPAATTAESCDRLRAAVLAGGQLSVCFQRRHSPLHAAARADLRIGGGAPVDYHAVVFEEPLPPRHWYTWPVSGGRLVSNGVHWIDEFLALNDYAPVAAARALAHPGRPDDVQVSLRLDNGALFSLALTATGARRVGLRDHVELRVAGRSARLTDGRHYVAESDTRVLRRLTTRRLDSYRRMYGSLCRAAAAGRGLDDATSAVAASLVAVELQSQLPQAVGERA